VEMNTYNNRHGSSANVKIILQILRYDFSHTIGKGIEGEKQCVSEQPRDVWK